MEKEFFKKAQPVWLKGLEREKHITAGWVCRFYGKQDYFTLHIAASSLYRLFLNGQFIGHGPARAAHGYYRVDEIALPVELLKGENYLAIEVVNFYVNSFYVLKQAAFVQAELRQGGEVIAFTGQGGNFMAQRITDRLTKVQRYSFQRPFIEAYCLEEGYDSWRSSLPVHSPEIVEVEAKTLLRRRVPLPEYPILRQRAVAGTGRFMHGRTDRPVWQDRALFEVGETLEGYAVDELEVKVSMELDGCVTAELSTEDSIAGTGALHRGEFYIADMGINATGFLGIRLICEEDTLVMLVFDEVLTEGDVSYNRMSCVNAIPMELKKGSYQIETIQPYTCRYMKPMVFSGKVKIEELYIREYKNPDAGKAVFHSPNEVLNRIFEAGRETFAQNAVDVYMDCPSRERAGWLCDSFFTGRVEADLTGNHRVEDNFLENYALPESFADIPEGMVPMCYPSDHKDGMYIANWALWMILELYEYRARNRDNEILHSLQPRVEGILAFMKGLENEWELLEDVPGWVFVEWSKANELTDGVNFPSNMLYSASLLAAGRLYGHKEWEEKGLRIRKKVQELSYNGEWFCDQALREGGRLVRRQDATEVCQYYAFFFRVAGKESHPELFHRLMGEFGPDRERRGIYPQVAPANAFIGNYLRMELLSLDGRAAQLLKESVEYFDYMAVRTGTLWENIGEYASCNHGFASHIIHCFYRDILGVREIGEKTVRLHFADLPLPGCQGRIPLGETWLSVSWSRQGDCLRAVVNAPEGYEVIVSVDDTIRLEEVSILREQNGGVF